MLYAGQTITVTITGDDGIRLPNSEAQITVIFPSTEDRFCPSSTITVESPTQLYRFQMTAAGESLDQFHYVPEAPDS